MSIKKAIILFFCLSVILVGCQYPNDKNQDTLQKVSEAQAVSEPELTNDENDYTTINKSERVLEEKNETTQKNLNYRNIAEDVIRIISKSKDIWGALDVEEENLYFFYYKSKEQLSDIEDLIGTWEIEKDHLINDVYQEILKYIDNTEIILEAYLKFIENVNIKENEAVMSTKKETAGMDLIVMSFKLFTEESGESIVTNLTEEDKEALLALLEISFGEDLRMYDEWQASGEDTQKILSYETWSAISIRSGLRGDIP